MYKANPKELAFFVGGENQFCALSSRCLTTS